jgi:phosphopantothenoylcysteine synthetase/decarboxylase
MADPTASGESAPRFDLSGYELVVGVGGGIAAYKVCQVVSHLVQRGCGITVTMTAAGTQFITPLTFQALTQRQVFTTMWASPGYYEPQHLSLSEAADLFLVAPATANLIGKFAGGIADDLVTTLMIGRDCPALLAPAMNTRMWDNPIVQRNIETLRDLGYEFIEPGEGWLAERSFGKGRMAEPDAIIETVVQLLSRKPPRGRMTQERGDT